MDLELIRSLYHFFKDDPFRLEQCAGKLFESMDKNVAFFLGTQMARDVIGKYRIGAVDNEVIVDYAIEAQHWVLDNENGQFGVLVTTSFLGLKPYQEIIEVVHPILVIAAFDIVKILKENKGIQNVNELNQWLINEFKLIGIKICLTIMIFYRAID